MSTYIFGYWSLINKRSAKTSWDIYWNLIPVKVLGLSRNFSILATQLWMTWLWVHHKKNTFINGVLYNVWNNCDFTLLDERESGYSRIKIKYSDITYYTDCPKKYPQLSLQDTIYMYYPKLIRFPCEKYPITKSYIDICIEWCLDFWETFIRDFFSHTIFNWEILDDRSYYYPKRAYSVDQKSYNILDWYYMKYSKYIKNN